MLKLYDYNEIDNKTFNELIEKGVARTLTLADIEPFRGMRIIWTYPQYEGNKQNIFQTVVGEIGKDFAGRTVLFDADGNETGMFLDDDNIFNCSDDDRNVMFIPEDFANKALRINSLGDLADYINEDEDYPSDVEDIIIFNGWKIADEIPSEIAIDIANNERLEIDSTGAVVVPIYNTQIANKENKIKVLQENLNEMNSQTDYDKMSLYEYVKTEADNDPKFFSWLFDDGNIPEFGIDLPDSLVAEYKEFLNIL